MPIKRSTYVLNSLGDFSATLAPVDQPRGPPRLSEEQESTFTQPQNLLQRRWLSVQLDGYVCAATPHGIPQRMVPAADPLLAASGTWTVSRWRCGPSERHQLQLHAFIRGPAECNHQLWWAWFQHCQREREGQTGGSSSSIIPVCLRFPFTFKWMTLIKL